MLFVIFYFQALSAADQLKARRRNVVPAKVGFYSFIFMSLFEPFAVMLHFIPIEVGKWDSEKILRSSLDFLFHCVMFRW